MPDRQGFCLHGSEEVEHETPVFRRGSVMPWQLSPAASPLILSTKRGDQCGNQRVVVEPVPGGAFLLHVKRSPVGALALPMPVGGNGGIFHSSLMVSF